MRVLALNKGKISLGQGLTTMNEKREMWVGAMGKKGELHSFCVRVGCWKG